jgi:hypothetical protein
MVQKQSNKHHTLFAEGELMLLTIPIQLSNFFYFAQKAHK